MKTPLRLLVAALLLTAPAGSHAANTYFRVPAGAFPPPSADSTIHALLPDNAGQCVAVWDQLPSSSVLIELRGTNGAQVWAHALTGLADGEHSRLALAGPGRVLWASASQWRVLHWDTGAVIANGTWDHPDLDSRKVLVRGNSLFIQHGRYETVAVTNAPPPPPPPPPPADPPPPEDPPPPPDPESDIPGQPTAPPVVVVPPPAETPVSDDPGGVFVDPEGGVRGGHLPAGLRGLHVHRV
jgi:hypothetical protein